MRLPFPERRPSKDGERRLSQDDEEAQASSPTERTALIAGMDRQEERYYKLKPSESIYSFFIFMPPVEYRATGRRCNFVLCFALGLVILNIIMQAGLMFVVSRDSMHREDSVMKRLIHVPPPWYQVHKKLMAKPSTGGAAGCVPMDTLCTHVGDQISCAPKSIGLLQHWDELDVDGDGIWSRTEVENQTHREDIRCRFGSDPLVLYGSMVTNLQGQPSLDGRLHPNLEEGKEIHKAYFDWYQGEPLLCRNLDEDSCGNLFQDGVFDEAIRTGAPFTPEINDLQSARGYCSSLLHERCNQILPVSFHTWKVDAMEMCGTKEFSSVPYDSPDKDPNNGMYRVKYQAPAEYQKYRSWIFSGYLATLLLTFFCTMLAEWKDIYRTMLYCIQFPQLRGGANDYFQRFSVILLTLLRIGLWIFIGYGGTLFLTSKTDYLGMIFDALSLAFIITIDELIYATMLRSPLKSAHQELEALVLHRRKWWLSVHCLEAIMLILVVGAAAFVAYSYQMQELKPIAEALECLCSAAGPKCHEASIHSKDWWDTYWAETVPKASLKIDRLFDVAA
jgi:hypothetical protein